ncbi:MAG: SufS family cysteine desulfurase [Lachnospiraceae bacterium]|nr:SufS family cysteine desulfurase [Lachnospiraceae bacterium]
MGVNPYRNDFPVFRSGKYKYLDSAATAQRPDCVIEAEKQFYETMNANPLRGLYELSINATEAYEEARKACASLIGATPSEIIFVRNATEALNLVAYSYGLNFLKEGDEIVTTVMEHHSNMLPWRMVAEKTGAVLRYLEPEPDGSFTDEELGSKITEKTRLVALGHISNVLGCENPVNKISELAHRYGAVTVVDAAQSVPHIRVDVNELSADFLAFSGHKLMGPFGIGVLYGKKELLEKMPPFFRGGEMIESVTLKGETWAELPHKFEAGTVNAAGAWGLKAAIEYLNSVGYDNIKKTEDALTVRLMEGFKKYPYVRIQGSEDPYRHNGIVSFTVDGVHPHDISSILDGYGINVRAGHHCAEPLMHYLNVQSTARASLYLYNNEEDVDALLDAIPEIRKMLGYQT